MPHHPPAERRRRPAPDEQLADEVIAKLDDLTARLTDDAFVRRNTTALREIERAIQQFL